MSGNLLVLMARDCEDDNERVCGIYTSLDALRRAVHSYIEFSPSDILLYELWESNELESLNEWDWCYIPNHSNPIELVRIGSVPDRVYWGKNLVSVDWEPLPEEQTIYLH